MHAIFSSVENVVAADVAGAVGASTIPCALYHQYMLFGLLYLRSSPSSTHVGFKFKHHSGASLRSTILFYHGADKVDNP